MKENLGNGGRTWKEKALDVGFSALSLVTLPVWVVNGWGALVAGRLLPALGFGVLAVSDIVTIKETFQEKKSILNPSYWVDKIIGKGRDRVSGTNQRLLSTPTAA